MPINRRLFTILALSAPTPALAWPADAAWAPLPGTGVPDSDNDRSNGGIFLELAGTAPDPAVWWAVDDDAVYFRIHVGEDPHAAGNSLDFGSWAIYLDTDGIPTTLEYALERAHEYAQSAKDALRPFPSSEDKETLVLVADFVVDRDR